MTALDLRDALGGGHDDEVRGSLDHCVKCTICETSCPVSAVTPLFPGPKYAGPQSERFRVAGELSPDASVDLCSGCGICTQVCPHGVHIAEINSRARAQLKQARGVPLRDRIITRPTILGRLGTPVAPLVNATIANPVLRYVGEKVLGVHRSAPAPRFAGRTFGGWAKRHRPLAADKRIVFFHGCGTDFYEPRLGEMTVAILEHHGFRVDIPKQGCCGLPLQSSGLHDDARGALRRLAGALAPHADGDTLIVGTSTSCTLMLKREGPEVLGLAGEEEIDRVAGRTWDICELLLHLHDRGELRTDFSPVAQTITYHAPCQQQGHNIGKPALDLFALVPGLEVIEHTAACCGIAGTYGLKQEKYEIAMKVGADLFAQVATHAPDVVACDSETCRWQIEHGTGVRSVHPLELLHQAYGLT